MTQTMVVDEKQASKILNVAVQTLRNWRHMRRGPAYIKFGRAVRYPLSDLEQYIQSNRIDPEGRA
jgi:hypothetical protein